MTRVSAMPIVRTQTTRTPWGPRSTARDLVSDSSAPKAAPMAEVFTVPRDGVPLRKTTTPDPRPAMCRAAVCRRPGLRAHRSAARVGGGGEHHAAATGVGRLDGASVRYKVAYRDVFGGKRPSNRRPNRRSALVL